MDPRRRQTTPDRWTDVLKRIRDEEKLCQVFVSPEGAMRIVEEIGGKGFLLVINDYDGELRRPERVEEWLRMLEREDVSRGRGGY